MTNRRSQRSSGIMIENLTLSLWLRLIFQGYIHLRFYMDYEYEWPESPPKKPFIGHDYYGGYFWIVWIGNFTIEGTP